MDNTFNLKLASANNSIRLYNSLSHSTTSHEQSTTYNPIQQRTTNITSTRNSVAITERCDRNSISTTTNNTRFLQSSICNLQEKRRASTSVQPEKAQLIYNSTTFQNGNTSRGYTYNQTQQLDDFHRFIRCFSTYPGTPIITTIPTFSLEKYNLSVQDDTFWTVLSSLAVYKNHQAYPRMGSTPEHSSQLLSRRLDSDCGLISTSAAPDTISTTETAITRMDYQHEQITPYTYSTTRTPRLLIEYHNNDSATARTKDSRFTEEYSTNHKSTNPISTNDTQPNYEDSISNVCSHSSSPIHTAFTTNEESDGTINSRLGHKASPHKRMSQGITLVATQPSIMEWEEYPSPNTSTHNLCGCKQHRMGLQSQPTQSTTTNSIRSLDSPRSQHVDKLERVESCFSCFKNFSPPTEHARTHQDRQHYINVVYKQTRRNEIFDVDDTSNHSMEMVPEARNQYSIESHSRCVKSNSRFRIKKTIPKEQLDDTTINISTNTILLGAKRRRSFCRSEYDTVKKVRIVASGSWQLRDRCFYPILEAIPISVSQSTMESYHPLSTEITTRTSTSDSHDHTLLENCHLVPSSSSSQHQSTNSTRPQDINHPSITSSNMAHNSQQQLEARRVEILNTQYQHTTLNHEAQQLLTQHNLQNSSTNRSYQRGQLLLLKWASDHNISDNQFSPFDLINFLSTMKSTHNYAVTTIQLFRSAVTQLHQNPNSLREDPLLNKFIYTLTAQAPPLRLHRPTIDLQPTFNFLSNIDNASTSLASLQGKLAFLLGVACFFRPSDLQRIPFESVQVSSDLTSLSLEVHCPKEKRRGRRIIKSFQVCAHNKSPNLCPIQTFFAYRERRPQCSSTSLFVNSFSPDKPLQHVNKSET